jgi:hypothetical protein
MARSGMLIGRRVALALAVASLLVWVASELAGVEPGHAEQREIVQTAQSTGTNPVGPARLVETRSGAGETTIDRQLEGIGERPAGSTLEVPVLGRGGVPSVSVGAVFLNVTAVFPAASGYLTVYPCGTTRPLASNVNYTAGQVVPNAVLAKVGAGGKVCIYTLAPTHLVVDVNGYTSDGAGTNPVGSVPATTVASSTTTLATTTSAAPVVSGRSFFVDGVAGSDANAGTSPDSPWRSLDKVNRTVFSPGDVVSFKRGSSWSTGLVLNSSGTAGAPITYRAYGTGPAPTIDNASLGTAIRVNGSYSVVRDFRLVNVFYTGVEILGGYNIASDNEIAFAGSGMWLSGPGNHATRNYVHDLKMVVNTPGGNEDYGAVGFWVSAADNEVSYNRCVNCKAPSLDYGYDGGFVEVWQVGDNLDVHHNIAVNTDGFLEVGGRGTGASARNVNLAYNLLVDTGVSLCLHHDWMPIDHVTFDNNTVIGPNRVACVSTSYPGFSSTLLTMRNNVFSGNGTIAGFPFTHSHNVYTANPGYALTSTERLADPQFVDAAAGDYRLRTGSPAINAGTNLGYTTDLTGNPVSPPPDLGAHEHTS